MTRRLLPLLALAALVLLFLRQATFTNLIFARGDTLLYFYPYWAYRAQALLAGRLPLWNPYLFMGAPFLANSQAGVFYPLNWPLIVFSPPVAVKISIVVHLIIAARGAFALARHAFELEPLPAAFAAAVFALGGYVTAQVEHVNQLQGLAWMPLTLLMAYRISRIAHRTSPVVESSSLPVTHHPPGSLLHSPLSRSSLSHCSLSHCSLFIVSLSLQLTAGHTQTAFITLVACGAVALFNTQYTIRNTRQVSRFTPYTLGIGILGFGIFLSFALSAVQLLPTYELSRLSLRGGGLPLNEAVSFSLNPLLLGRALLPGYSRLIYSEFVGYIGVIPLMLAIFALPTLWRKKNGAPSDLRPPTSNLWLAALLAALGLFFALGGYNPIYLLLARFVPGFNLFRVPARWLALWALGAAMLAGFGLQKLRRVPPSSISSLSSFLFPLSLIILTLFSASVIPAGELGPIGLPAPLDIILWITPLILTFVVSRFTQSRLQTAPTLLTQHASRIPVGIWQLGFGIFGIFELLLASQSLPLNHLTTPDAYSSIRPAMTQLLAVSPVTLSGGQSAAMPEVEGPPPARFLSLSALEFDPGDLKELTGELGPQLPPDAVYDAIIAAKHKEVLSPNLPLVWNVPAVDGYDGGILPLRQYVEFAENFGPVDPNTDGRLRQTLKTIPPNWLLNLTNTRWIIADKTGDAWMDNVFYDLGITANVTPDQPLTIGRVPKFQTTALGLVLSWERISSATGQAHLTFADGTTAALPFTADSTQPAVRLHFDKPSTLTALTITAETALTVRGASLINERADTFQSLTLGPYRLAHSGDVKIYENLNVLPRAFIASDVMLSAEEPVLSLSKDAKHLQAETLHASGAQGDNVSIIKYNAERVIIQTTTDAPGYLILTDEYYPGWIATLDSQPADILRAYGLFRAVALPAGSHTVEFRFEPQSLKLGVIISGVSLIILVGLLILSFKRRTSNVI